MCERKKTSGRAEWEGRKKRSINLETAKFPPVERRQLYIAVQL